MAITSGCNQAFCAVMSTIASAGDAVILPTPWYFNHKMWLDTAGVETRLLPCGEGMLPDPEAARGLIDEKVKAIILVTPNNPTGAEYPKGLLDAFMALAQEHGLALIVDETYRDFHSQSGAYFTYVEHPFDIPSDEIAKLLVQQQSLLILPGTMFQPTGTDGKAEKQLRIAFANADKDGLNEMFKRLKAFRP